MFLILAVVLVVMWLGGFVMFKSAGMLIHLLLLFAVISIILHFITGSRSAVEAFLYKTARANRKGRARGSAFSCVLAIDY